MRAVCRIGKQVRWSLSSRSRVTEEGFQWRVFVSLASHVQVEMISLVRAELRVVLGLCSRNPAVK